MRVNCPAGNVQVQDRHFLFKLSVKRNVTGLTNI